jgi:hypothetical protein
MDFTYSNKKGKPQQIKIVRINMSIKHDWVKNQIENVGGLPNIYIYNNGDYFKY